jgi:hypothetical protein
LIGCRDRNRQKKEKNKKKDGGAFAKRLHSIPFEVPDCASLYNKAKIRSQCYPENNFENAAQGLITSANHV